MLSFSVSFTELMFILLTSSLFQHFFFFFFWVNQGQGKKYTFLFQVRFVSKKNEKYLDLQSLSVIQVLFCFLNPTNIYDFSILSPVLSFLKKKKKVLSHLSVNEVLQLKFESHKAQEIQSWSFHSNFNLTSLNTCITIGFSFLSLHCPHPHCLAFPCGYAFDPVYQLQKLLKSFPSFWSWFRICWLLVILETLT